MSYVDVRAPGSFGGIGSVRRYGGNVKDAYTQHKTIRVRFPRKKRIRRDMTIQIDLVDLENISSYNDGYRYLLTCIDVFTKRASAVAVKTKSGRDVTEAFEKILADGRKPNMVQSNKGTEFLNSTFQSMLK